MDYSNSEIRQAIDEWVHSERDRRIMVGLSMATLMKNLPRYMICPSGRLKISFIRKRINCLRS